MKREIYEETGIMNINVKNCVFSRIAHAELRNMEQNLYYERYYLVEMDDIEINTDHLTNNEIEVIKDYKWWAIDELKQTKEIVFPPLLKMKIDAAIINRNYPMDITDSDELIKL